MTARRIFLVLLGLALVGGAAGATYAFWSASVTLPGAVVVHGDLDIELAGEATWRQLEPEVGNVGMRADGMTAAHLATPGDVLTLTQQFRTSLEGNNLAARLNVDWTDPAALGAPGAVTTTYVITPPNGIAGTSRPLGTPSTFPEAPANITPETLASWGAAPWTLTVRLEYTGNDIIVAPSEITAPRFTELGTIQLELAQVRDGDGFSS